jgi:hypothetical protein
MAGYARELAEKYFTVSSLDAVRVLLQRKKTDSKSNAGSLSSQAK